MAKVLSTYKADKYHARMDYQSSPRVPRQPSTRQLNVRHTRNQGFSLIEVLVSMLILSFGLLGMVGLQAAALQANRDARMQSTAGSLAHELAEVLRGSNIQDVNGVNNPYLGDFKSPLTAATPAYCLNVDRGTVPCADRQSIGNALMTEWLARVEAELPGARVSVCRDSAPFDAEGLPQWTCTSASGDPPMVIKIGWTRRLGDRSKSGAAGLDRAARPTIVLPVVVGNRL